METAGTGRRVRLVRHQTLELDRNSWTFSLKQMLPPSERVLLVDSVHDRSAKGKVQQDTSVVPKMKRPPF